MAVIRVLEVGEVPKKYLDVLVQELNKKSKIYRFTLGDKLPLPANAFDKYRQQYKADEMLKLARDARVLFITNADLYTENRNFIFGLTKGNGPSVVSFARLDPTFYGNSVDFATT